MVNWATVTGQREDEHVNELTLENRLGLNALLDRLVADGDSFSRADAEALISQLPLSRKPSVVQVSGRWRGTTRHDGYAAGHGRVTLDDTRERSLELGQDNCWRIGGYKVEHRPGIIEIALMWSDTMEVADGQVCRLMYDRRSGQPSAMYLARDLSFSMGALHVTYWRVFDFWKRPA